MGSDIREQTRNCLERIKVILEAAGTSLDNVVSATCWLNSRENFAAFNEVYTSYFVADKPAEHCGSSFDGARGPGRDHGHCVHT